MLCTPFSLEGCDVALEILLQSTEEAFAQSGKLGTILRDIPEMDCHIRLKRDGRQRRTIGDAHEDAARHRIAIEGDAELGERGTVGRCYLL